MGRPTWTFITNHGAVLALIGHQEQITAREIAARLGITVRAVQRIIKDLETEGYLSKTKKGRLNHYSVNRTLSLRRRDQSDVLVSELLTILVADN